MTQDIVEILPFEIWERCIAEACQGENYMANLLTLTMVSAKWCQFLMETPTLWATIHLNDADEDSIATVAVFLQLSCEVQVSLRIWVPLSETWKTVCSMLLRQSRRIREVILQTDSRSHLALCSLQSTVNDAQLCGVLETVFKTLHYPVSIRYIDVDLNRPVKMGSIRVPENLVSMGNWLVPWSILKSPGIFPRLRYLSINAVDLTRLLPHFSALGHLRHLYLHSGEQDYIQPPPPPSDSVINPLNLPFLDTLRYHGRFYLAPTQLLRATSRTIQYLDLRIGLLDLNVAVQSLEVCHSLRRLSLTLLMLEYDLDSSNARRLYLSTSVRSLISKMKIPNWRLRRVEDFKCEMKTLGGGQISQNLNVDYLWHLFHTIFPNLEGLVWNVPIQSNMVVTSLIKQKKLRRFESYTVPASSYTLPRGSAHHTLESLHITDVRMFRGMFTANLLHFSATFQEKSRTFTGLTFRLLQSLNLKIGESVKNSWNLEPTNFPALKVLSIAFLGPRNGFQLPDLPSLTEITISTLSPTYTQGMDFCASLACDPKKFPRLEQIDLDSFLEWDILYLLLRRRNVLQNGSMSRIKRLRLPFMPPKFHAMFASLLSGLDSIPFPFHWSMMTRLGIQGTQSRLLDPQIMGCFCCVQLGLAGCNEPLQASRLPEEYRTPWMGNHNISEVAESLGLFPIFNWDITRPLIRGDSVYEAIWMAGRQERAEEWRNTACEWSNLHHRTLICHKQLCSPKIMVTEYDAENEDTRPDIPSLAILSLSDSDEVLPNTTDLAKAELHDGILPAILLLIKLARDTKSDVRSNATSALAKLVVHAELHDTIRAAIRSLIRLIGDTDSDRRSGATSALTQLAVHAELRGAIEPAIPSLIKLLGDEHHYVRIEAASALANLAVHAELRDAIEPAIPSLVRLIRDINPSVRSEASSVLAKLAARAELRGGIETAIPSLIKLLGDEHHYVRIEATSALANLAVHAELRDAIEPAIPSLIKLLGDEHDQVRSAATSAFAKLAFHAEPRGGIETAIPSLIKLLGDEHHYVRIEATSALANLAVHAELRDAIEPAIPSLVRLIRDINPSVRSEASSVLAKLAAHAELCDAIKPAIPTIIGLLGNWSGEVKSAAISALTQLAAHAELCDAIKPAIPTIIGLLGNWSGEVKSAAISALAKLAVHAELHDAIKPAIPSLIRLLHETDFFAPSKAISALTELAVLVELRDAIKPAILPLIRLLSHRYSWVQSDAISALAKLAVHAELCDAIKPAIPTLIELLGHWSSEVQSAAISALAKLAVHAELCDAIKPAIPTIIGLLGNWSGEVKSAAISALTQLAAHAELHGAIRPAIPSLIKLLGDKHDQVRSAATSALAKLAVHAQSRDAILAATPLLVQLLEDNYSGDAAVSALAELAAHTGFSDAIRPAIPSLIEQLQDPGNDVRYTATYMLATLARDDKLCDVIRPAIPSLMELFETGDSDIKLAAAAALVRLLPFAHDG